MNSLFHNQHEKHSHWGDNRYKGANFTRELHVVLTSSVMIRRLKKDILKSLPKKSRYLLKIEIENNVKKLEFQKFLYEMKQYEELMKKKSNVFRKTAPVVVMNGNSDDEIEDNDDKEEVSDKTTTLMKLFSESGKEKLPAMLKYITRYMEKYPNNKILLFAHHLEVLDGVSNYCDENKLSYIRIDGSTSAEVRFGLCESFQNDINIRIGVLGITAAGIALTLTSANIVFFLELYWTPGALIQAEDRVHRIGQLQKVEIYYFFAEHTIDELLWPLIRKKMQLLGIFYCLNSFCFYN